MFKAALVQSETQTFSKIIIGAVVALGALLGVGLAQPGPSSTSEDQTCPVPYQAQPRGEDLHTLYPSRAYEEGVVGVVRVRCTVRKDGGADCAVIDETPEGWGFGDATLAAAGLFRIAPEDCHGASTTGSTFQRTIRWGNREEYCTQVVIAGPKDIDFENAFPERALVEGVAGRVDLSCVVGAGGATTCAIATEEPLGYGFGAASLALAQLFRARKFTCDGIPTDGTHFSPSFTWRAEWVQERPDAVTR